MIDSVQMTVTLTETKMQKLRDLLIYTLDNTCYIKIRSIARIIGHMISSLPAVRYEALYYRQLENDKVIALKMSKGNFENYMSVSEKGISELRWWLHNIENSYNVIFHSPVDITLYSDASLKGWGAVMGNVSTGGRWSPDESEYHINCLELKAALFALKCFRDSISGKHVKIMIDNTTAVAVIQNMGTCHSDSCNSIVLEIWEFCISKNIWLTAAHIPGSCNIIADRESRNFRGQDTEWMLNPTLLNKALHTLNFKPQTDFFASRLNRQFKKYGSFRPDPDARDTQQVKATYPDNTGLALRTVVLRKELDKEVGINQFNKARKDASIYVTLVNRRVKTAYPANANRTHNGLIRNKTCCKLEDEAENNYDEAEFDNYDEPDTDNGDNEEKTNFMT